MFPGFFGQLRSDVETAGAFAGLDRRTFAYRSAVYIAELDYLHPFPEGNGRTQRILLEEIARRAGHDLDHHCITGEAWNEAAADYSYGQDQYGQKGGTVKFGPHRKMTACIESALGSGRSQTESRIGQKAAELRVARKAAGLEQDEGEEM